MHRINETPGNDHHHKMIFEQNDRHASFERKNPGVQSVFVEGPSAEI